MSNAIVIRFYVLHSKCCNCSDFTHRICDSCHRYSGKSWSFGHSVFDIDQSFYLRIGKRICSFILNFIKLIKLRQCFFRFNHWNIAFFLTVWKPIGIRAECFERLSLGLSLLCCLRSNSICDYYLQQSTPSISRKRKNEKEVQ